MPTETTIDRPGPGWEHICRDCFGCKIEWPGVRRCKCAPGKIVKPKVADMFPRSMKALGMQKMSDASKTTRIARGFIGRDGKPISREALIAEQEADMQNGVPADDHPMPRFIRIACPRCIKGETVGGAFCKECDGTGDAWERSAESHG